MSSRNENSIARGTVRQCGVCGSEFPARHSKHFLCGKAACSRIDTNAKMNAWKLRTGRSNGPKENLWTDAEKKFLSDNRFMSTAEIAIALGRSADSIREKRFRMKLPELAVCTGCNGTFQRKNQHDQCLSCVPSQAEYNKSHNNTISRRWSYYKQNAKKRGLAFDLDLAQFAEFWKKPCTYCGSEIDTVGIDRIESEKGYIVGNLVACCARCNEMKNDRTVDQWMADMKRVLNHTGVTV